MLTMRVKYLPNIISLIRLLLVFPFVHFFLAKKSEIAFFIFILAASSDAIDGWIARHFKCQSHLGLILDPLADKILIVSCYLLLGFTSILPLWLVGLVLLRDLSIISGSFVSMFYFKKTHPMRPSMLSKINTVLQMLQIFICLFQSAFHCIPLWIEQILLIGASLTTSASFFHYLYIWHLELKQKAL